MHSITSSFRFLFRITVIFTTLAVLNLLGLFGTAPLEQIPYPARTAAYAKSFAPAKPEYRKFTMYTTDIRPSKNITARLIASGKYISIWSSSSNRIMVKNAVSLANRFDKTIYPNDIRYFADKKVRTEVKHLNILVTDLGSLDGYFDSANITYDRLYLVFINTGLLEKEYSEACNTVAHEFEHILFFEDGGVDIEWLDEGLAVYAEHINGSYPNMFVRAFIKNPNVSFSRPFTSANSNYGAAFLFIATAALHVEESRNSVTAFTQDLINNSNNGIQGINSTLHRFIKDGRYDTFSEIYQPKSLIRNVNSIKNRR